MSTMLEILHFRCSISYFKRQFCIDENLNIRQIFKSALFLQKIFPLTI